MFFSLFLHQKFFEKFQMQHFATLGAYISGLHKGASSWCHLPYLGTLWKRGEGQKKVLKVGIQKGIIFQFQVN